MPIALMHRKPAIRLHGYGYHHPGHLGDDATAASYGVSNDPSDSDYTSSYVIDPNTDMTNVDTSTVVTDDGSGSTSGININAIPLPGVANILSSISTALGITKPAPVYIGGVLQPVPSTNLSKYLLPGLIAVGVLYFVMRKKR